MTIHPGAMVALKRLDSNELETARMIASGDLESPQRFINMWLYAIRITGTGASYRPKLDEFVYRRPENYLTKEFLERCAGLPVIWIHPDSNILDSTEFAQRVIGGVMFAYVGGKDKDEVWAIARIYDEQAIAEMQRQQMSTSPGVLLGPSRKYTTKDGDQVIDEGESRLLDHIAIVRKGVWDKDGDVAPGVQGDIRGDSAVVDQNQKIEETGAKADAEKDEKDNKDKSGDGLESKLDALLSGLEGLRGDVASCNSRLDAWEDEGEDEDDKEKDKEEDEGERDDEEGDEPDNIVREAESHRETPGKRGDARGDARADSLEREVRSLRALTDRQSRDLAAAVARLPKDVTDADYHAMLAHQARADDVFSMNGERAPRPLNGESPDAYRRRIVNMLKTTSKNWKDIDIDAIRDDSAFTTIEAQVFADAVEAAKTPTVAAGGGIRAHTRTGPNGHVITDFYGSDDVHFVSQMPFARAPRRVKGIRFENA